MILGNTQANQTAGQGAFGGFGFGNIAANVLPQVGPVPGYNNGLDWKDPEEAQAELLRRDYFRNIDLYRPLQDRLFETLGNFDNITQAARTRAINDARGSFDQSQAAANRNLKSFGIELNSDQRKSLTRQYDIAAARSVIDAANKTTRDMEQLRLGLVGGIQSYQGV